MADRDGGRDGGARSRAGLPRQAIRLEQFSVAWMLAQAGVAATAGIIAGSLALTSFGFDSVIELVSATLVLRRLRADLGGGEPSERAERRVLRIIAMTFFALDAYVIIASVIDFATRAHPERSPIGIGLTSALLVMPLLRWRKRRVGAALPGQLLTADAAETILCATLAATTLLGLFLFGTFGRWWADAAGRVRSDPPGLAPAGRSGRAGAKSA